MSAGHRAAAVYSAILVALANIALGALGDAEWTVINPGPATASTRVHAMALDRNGNLIIGGKFSAIGGQNANSIIRWNGSWFSPLGAGVGVPGPNNDNIYAITSDGGGRVYAGGWFTTAGGAAAAYVARWDGSSWSALGTGLDNIVLALATDSLSNIYAGGLFFSAGGISANSVARWNGSNWSALGTGMDGGVWALALDKSGNLYAGGGFDTAGDRPASNIARWNGRTWSALGSGLNATVYALAVDESGNVYAGGDFTTAGGQAANGIARWNGSSWSALGNGVEGTVDAITVDGSGNVYAGGNFTKAGGQTANRLARWNGKAWTALGVGLDGSVSSLVLETNFFGVSLYVGGYFTTAGGSLSPFVAKVRPSSVVLSPLQSWRQANFGTTANTGDAADGFDYDKDGTTNVLEWAMGLDPKNPDDPELTVKRSDSNLELGYRRSIAAVESGAQFVVESCPDLKSGTWSSTGVVQSLVSSDGSVQKMKAVMSITNSTHRFARLKVILPP